LCGVVVGVGVFGVGLCVGVGVGVFRNTRSGTARDQG
jgi:hypothetical protein